jgi:hypothetical protein
MNQNCALDQELISHQRGFPPVEGRRTWGVRSELNHFELMDRSHQSVLVHEAWVIYIERKAYIAAPGLDLKKLGDCTNAGSTSLTLGLTAIYQVALCKILIESQIESRFNLDFSETNLSDPD